MRQPSELSPSQAAARIGTSTRTVQRWIANGSLPARRVGDRWRVAYDALDAFQHTQHARPSQPTPAAPATRPIGTVFIANRGEIAARIRRTCDRLGIRIVVPGEDGRPVLDLLDPDVVIGGAVAAGADAVHPGFGFLSENPDFAQRVIDAGMAWIGPPPAAIRAMGDKAAARRLAARLDIPIIPGYDDADQSDRALTAGARTVGLPLIVKPAAGGGGKGMHVVREMADLRSALWAARREALAAFGDDRLILEHYLEGPRHVEIQLLFDAHGQGVHLGERDCSIQRRHQKVLEETPSPAVDADLRGRLGGAALALAKAVGYVNAGTCEFLLSGGRFFFLEMNTRLQVEHPVTEMATGRDLVADQLRIAGGEPLGFDQSDVGAALARGIHAVEVRLYAEDADAGFLPATGRVEALHWPTDPGGRVRVDAGIVQGSVVDARFDPMLAKIVAAGADRGSALDRLASALDSTTVLGLTTNLRFLRWLVRTPVVLDGEARVDTLDRIWPPSDRDHPNDPPDDAWQAAARVLAGTTADGGWRLNSGPRLRIATEDGSQRAVAVPDPVVEPSRSAVLGSDRTAHVDVDGRSVAFELAAAPDVDRALRVAVAQHGGSAQDVCAPMPGSVLAVHRSVGAAVEAGDPLVTLEAMKMEHVVTATAAGTVVEIHVRPADQVRRGQVLAVLE